MVQKVQVAKETVIACEISNSRFEPNESRRLFSIPLVNKISERQLIAMPRDAKIGPCGFRFLSPSFGLYTWGRWEFFSLTLAFT